MSSEFAQHNNYGLMEEIRLAALSASAGQRELLAYYPYWPELAEYLTDFSVRQKLMYLATPKTGCSSVRRLLQFIELDGKKDLLPEFAHDKSTSPFPAVEALGIRVAEVMESPGFRRLTTVRNPFTRVLSAYLDKIVTNEWERERLLPTLSTDLKDGSVIPSFREFLILIRAQNDMLRDIHWATQSYLTQPECVNYTSIGRFENLEPFIATIARGHGLEMESVARDLRVDFHRTGSAERVGEFYGPEERDLVIEIYDRDFASFQYSRDLDFHSC